ncbi:MAG TPA: GAF domain-containing protein [Vicinamibacterales bacterium]|jgi:hypothetical protein
MSLEDRINQLSDSIMQEIRGPVDAALRGILADVLRVAAEERETAVRDAVQQADAARDAAVHAERVAVTSAHEQALETHRQEFNQSHDEALAALRETLGRQHEEALSALRTEVGSEHETALATLRGQLEAERDAAVHAERVALTSAHDQALETHRQEFSQSHDEALAALRGQFEAERDQAVHDARAALARDHQAVVAELEARVASTGEDAAGLAAMTAAMAKTEHDRHEARQEAAQLAQDLTAARTELSAAREEAVRADRARILAEDATEQARAAAAHEHEQVQLAAAQELDAHAVERQAELACSERIVEAFRRLDAAQSLTEVLDILTTQTGVEVARVAVLLVRGTRLRGWKLAGMPTLQPEELDLPVDGDTALSRAIATGYPVATSDAPLALPDGHGAAIVVPPGRVGLAMPLLVGGRAIGVLYADDGDEDAPVVPSHWPETAEILVRHAAHRLEVLTISRAATLATRVQHQQRMPELRPPGPSPFADERREEESARRYARLLISEIKLYNETLVEQGRQDRDLLKRLGPEIERARRLYEEKIPAAVRHRADCFDEEMVRTLAGGDPGLLGQVP